MMRISKSYKLLLFVEAVSKFSRINEKTVENEQKFYDNRCIVLIVFN